MRRPDAQLEAAQRNRDGKLELGANSNGARLAPAPGDILRATICAAVARRSAQAAKRLFCCDGRNNGRRAANATRRELNCVKQIDSNDEDAAAADDIVADNSVRMLARQQLH